MDQQLLDVFAFGVAAAVWLAIDVAKKRFHLPGEYVPNILGIGAAVVGAVAYWLTKDAGIAIAYALAVGASSAIEGKAKRVRRDPASPIPRKNDSEAQP